MWDAVYSKQSKLDEDYVMDKNMKSISLSVWFDENGKIKPSRWHCGSKILDLVVLRNEEKEESIRYTCRCDDDDEWEYFVVTLIFDKHELKWYVEE